MSQKCRTVPVSNVWGCSELLVVGGGEGGGERGGGEEGTERGEEKGGVK
jgi:hypothetical protein